MLSQVHSFRTSAAFQLSLFLDCWFLLRAPCYRIPRTAKHYQLPDVSHSMSSLHLLVSTAQIHRCCQAYRQKLLASTLGSTWLHPQNGFAPSTLLQVAQLLQCSPSPRKNDTAFYQLPSLANCLRPICTLSCRPAHQHMTRSNFCLVHWDGFSKCPKLSLSNSLALHAPSFLSSWRCSHNQSCGLTPFDRSIWHIKSAWLLVTFQFCLHQSLSIVEILQNSATHDLPGHLFSLPQQKIDRNHHRCFRTTRRFCCKHRIKLNRRNVLQIHHLFGVFSIRTLALDADLTPCTKRTMCGFMGLKFLFRGLARLWKYLDLHMINRV